MKPAPSHPHHLPPRATQQPVFAAINGLSSPYVFETFAPGRVVLDGDHQLGDHNVWPHFEMREERLGYPNRVETRLEAQPVANLLSQEFFCG